MHASSLPNCCYLLAVVTLTGLGCQSQQSTGPNPFQSADRVPPPATRAPAPGMAQPYYPGDPLPAMPGASVRSFSGSPLADAAPIESSHQNVSGVSAIAIPSDDHALRPATPRTFVHAAEQAPALSPKFGASPTEPATLGWISGSGPQPLNRSVAVTAQPIDRRVAVSPAPRIRLPGATKRSEGSGPQSLSSTATAMTVGHVQITELPPRPYTTSLSTTLIAEGSDGFRARGVVAPGANSPGM